MSPGTMSLNLSSANTANLYSVPKLAADGSNWITYKERILTVLGTRGLMRHLLGTARRPPAPPVWPRPPRPATPLASASTAYLKKVEEAETKADEYDQREFAARQQIYSTISDTMLLKVKYLPDAASVWAAIVNEY
ncbi:hypothetical protein BD310DRAFT_884822, partial [Dichomitus squalens]